MTDVASTMASTPITPAARLHTAVHHCAEETGCSIIFVYPPTWKAHWLLRILLFPITLIYSLRSSTYKYSAVGWTFYDKEHQLNPHGNVVYVRDVAGDYRPQFKYIERQAGPGWDLNNQSVSTATLLYHIGYNALPALEAAIRTAYIEAGRIENIATDITERQEAQQEIQRLWAK